MKYLVTIKAIFVNLSITEFSVRHSVVKKLIKSNEIDKLHGIVDSGSQSKMLISRILKLRTEPKLWRGA